MSIFAKLFSRKQEIDSRPKEMSYGEAHLIVMDFRQPLQHATLKRAMAQIGVTSLETHFYSRRELPHARAVLVQAFKMF